jgi:hypothetical protein
VNAGIIEPMHDAKTLRMMDVLTEIPKIGPNMPMVMRPGDINIENHMKIISF